MNIAVIILAAGSSSRMGKSKQLLEINGEPLLCHCTKVALEAVPEHVIVVLGANEKPHRDVLATLPVKIVSNHFWKTGMGSSIKTGLNYLLQSTMQPDGIIIMVCDQPALTSQHLQKLIQTFHETRKPIVASSYGGSGGVPVLFGRSFFSNLLLLADDHGAKRIVAQFPEQLATVEFSGGAMDLDTEEDYEKYLKSKV
jgi:molybdenum cofactor cytidylyltransferase